MKIRTIFAVLEVAAIIAMGVACTTLPEEQDISTPNNITTAAPTEIEVPSTNSQEQTGDPAEDGNPAELAQPVEGPVDDGEPVVPNEKIPITTETPVIADGYKIGSFTALPNDSVLLPGKGFASDKVQYENYLRDAQNEMNRAFADGLSGPDGMPVASFNYHFTPGKGEPDVNDPETFNRGYMTLDIHETGESIRVSAANWENTPYVELSGLGEYTFLTVDTLGDFIISRAE